MKVNDTFDKSVIYDANESYMFTSGMEDDRFDIQEKLNKLK
jgi:hypothetical protein